MIELSFDASTGEVQEVEEGKVYLIEFRGGIFFAQVDIEGREMLLEFYQEILASITRGGDDEISLGDYFEPQIVSLGGSIQITQRIDFGCVQVFHPSKVEPYWMFIFDDIDTCEQLFIRCSNKVAKELASKLILYGRED